MPTSSPSSVPSRRFGVVLPLHRIWLLSLPFRFTQRGNAATGPGFAPGLRNVLHYEKTRWGHRLYERDRWAYRWLQLRAWWR